jgi:hypothetical protein
MTSKQRDFLNRKFLEWQGFLKEPQTQKSFALFIGFPPTTYSNYLNTDTKPTLENLQKMVVLWGKNEVYDAFDIDSSLEVTDPLSGVTPRLRIIAFELSETISRLGISGDSPEAEKIADEIMKKYGYNLSSIKD